MKRTLFSLLLVFFTATIFYGQALQWELSLPDNGSTSANSRAPQGATRYARTVYIITAAEMAGSGLTSGNALAGIGFLYSSAQNVATTGTLKVYLQNSTDATNTKSTDWTTAITGMTLASNSTITIPATTGQVNFPFMGGSPFTYTGGAVYVAFEYENATGTLATTGNIALCNTSLVGGLKGAQSLTVLPTTLTVSNFRPATYFAKSVPCAAINNLSMTAYTENSASITWSPAVNAQIEWGLKPYAQGGGGSSATVTNGTTYTVTGLAPGKAYDVYIRADCGGGLLSEWRKITVGTTNSAPVSTYPYAMNFEPAADQNYIFNLGWGNQPTGNVGTWGWFSDDATDGNTANDYAHSPTYFIGSQIATTAQNAWIFSRPLAMTAGVTYSIQYYYRTFSTAATTAPVNFSVGINSTNSGTGATILASHTNYNNLTYATETLQYTPTTTGNYYIGFNNNTPARTAITTANYIFIDTVTVTSSQLGVNDLVSFENAIAIYPNPTSDMLNIKSKDKVTAVSISDMSGKRIEARVINNTVDVRGLQSGTYIINVVTEAGNSSQKFIKK